MHSRYEYCKADEQILRRQYVCTAKKNYAKSNTARRSIYEAMSFTQYKRAIAGNRDKIDETVRLYGEEILVEG